MIYQYDLLDFVLPCFEESEPDNTVPEVLRNLVSEVRSDPQGQWFLQQKRAREYNLWGRKSLNEAANEYLNFAETDVRKVEPWPVVDLVRAVIERAAGPISLTATEVRLLACLSRRPGVIIHHRILSDIISRDSTGAVWADPKHHIRNLRIKLGDNLRKPWIILTRPGMGYLLNENMKGRIKGLAEFSDDF